MMIASLLLVAFGGFAAAGGAPLLDDVEVGRLWERFQATWPREGGSANAVKRFAAFVDNALQAQARNLEEGVNCTSLFDDDNCVFGVTKFSDMRADEFASTVLGYKRGEPSAAEVLSQEGISTADTVVDWRTKGAVTPVKDQGGCGSCWAFSTTEEIESAAFMATGTLPQLSTQQIISCDKADQGCDGGDPTTAYKYVEQVGGLDLASDYPDKSHTSGKSGTCTWDKKKTVDITGFKYAVKPCSHGQCNKQDEVGLATALASVGPISICVNAASWQSYKHGIIKRQCSGYAAELDHCVQLVGYDQSGSTPYWIVRNSWNTDWGIDGYIHVAMGTNLCGIANEATIPQVAKYADPITV